MKRQFYFYLVISILFVFSATVMGAGRVVEIVTADDLPPASMQDAPDGYRGFYVEIFEAICKKAGFEPKFTYQPWIRAQETVSKGNNLVIIGMGRTPERESKFKWICYVYSTEWAFASINGKAYDLDSAKSLNSILLQSATPMVSILANAGYTNVSLVPENAMNAKKLAAGRGDAWASTIVGARWIWKRGGFSGKLTFGPVILKNDQWMAISPGSDESLANDLKKGLDDIRADGTFKKIFDRYY